MPLGWIELFTLVTIAIIAAVVRGYSGFGFSAIVIAGASLVIPPAALVPALYMLEIVASIHMLPGVRHQIDYPHFWPMLICCAIGLPAGQFLLTHLPADTIRVFLSLGVLVSTALIWRGYRFKTEMNRPLAGITGFLIGFGSGMASIGGLLAMVIFLGTNYPAAQTRAIFVAIFLVMYVYGTAVSGPERPDHNNDILDRAGVPATTVCGYPDGTETMAFRHSGELPQLRSRIAHAACGRGDSPGTADLEAWLPSL